MKIINSSMFEALIKENKAALEAWLDICDTYVFGNNWDGENDDDMRVMVLVPIKRLIEDTISYPDLNGVLSTASNSYTHIDLEA